MVRSCRGAAVADAGAAGRRLSRPTLPLLLFLGEFLVGWNAMLCYAIRYLSIYANVLRVGNGGRGGTIAHSVPPF